MKQFKHKATGRIAELNETDIAKIEIDKHNFDYAPNWLIENSNDWEEVVQKEYEVMSVITKSGEIWSKKDSSDTYFKKEEYIWVYLDSFGENWQIHSVKRLSDGEVFTIGDSVKYENVGKADQIEKFQISKDKLTVLFGNFQQKLIYVSKAKKPLFTTEDGVEIFEGDEFWYPNVHVWQVNSIIANETNYNYVVKINKYKTFSTKELAGEYILMNSPIFSVDDILKSDLCKFIKMFHGNYVDKLIELAKNKIKS